MITHEQSVDFVYPDEAEDESREVNIHREQGKKLIRLLNMQADFIINSPSQTIAMWAVSYALGLAVCEGVSISDKASDLDITPQALSKEMNIFRLMAGLPKSDYCGAKGKG